MYGELGKIKCSIGHLLPLSIYISPRCVVLGAGEHIRWSAQNSSSTI